MAHGPKPRPPEERFWELVEKTETCWLWRGRPSDTGYGVLGLYIGPGLKSNGVYAHRFSYELLVGPIPEGLVIDHLCRVTLCVNPDHLEPVTRRENTLRGIAPSVLAHAQGTCQRGHPMTPMKTGRRYCLTCNARRSRERRAATIATSQETRP